MSILGQLFQSLAFLTEMIFRILYFLLVIRIILSWFTVDTYNEPAKTLYKITDPILEPFRKLPLQIGMIDFSAIVAFVAINFVGNFIVRLLHQLAIQFMSVTV